MYIELGAPLNENNYPVALSTSWNNTIMITNTKQELSLQKLYKYDGKIDGYGLKYFPDKTKKDLRFFS